MCVCVCLQEKNKAVALELATLLLSMPTPAGVQQQTKGLLASLHTSRTAYHNHKVPSHPHTPTHTAVAIIRTALQTTQRIHLWKDIGT